MRKVQKKKQHAIPGAPKDPMAHASWIFCGALVPAVLTSVYYFGLPAIEIILVAVVSAVAFEAGLQFFLRQPVTLTDGNAFLTGLLLALCLSPKTPIGLAVIGAFVAIVVAKHLFIISRGHVLFNPVLFSKAVLVIAFPTIMAGYNDPVATVLGVDAKTAATPLVVLKQDGMGRLLEIYHTKAALYVDLFLGNCPGSLGETSVVVLLFGASFLVVKRCITWHIPVSFIATVGLLSWIFGGKEGVLTGDPLFHMLSGGLALGACFLATDPATSPRAGLDKLLFGISCGAITVLFRLKSAYPEGVMFAILIMNCAVPLLDPSLRSSVVKKVLRRPDAMPK